MNNELKDLNKKIRFINEAICHKELFKPKTQQTLASVLYQTRSLELTIAKYKVKLPLTMNITDYLKEFLFFGLNTKEFKRTIKEDKLISIVVIEEDSNYKMPISITKFKEMTSKIIFNWIVDITFYFVLIKSIPIIKQGDWNEKSKKNIN